MGFLKKSQTLAKKTAWLLNTENLFDGMSENVGEDAGLNLFPTYSYNGISIASKPFEDLVDESSEDESSKDDNNNFQVNSANTNNYYPSDTYEDRDYDVARTSEYIVAYIAGYVARKMQRFYRCEHCLASLEIDKSSDRDRVIDLMSEYCIRPSNNLYNLIKQLENVVLTVVGNKTVRFYTMNEIIDKVSKEKALPFVGCKEHRSNLMKKILNFFITIRGYILSC